MLESSDFFFEEGSLATSQSLSTLSQHFSIINALPRPHDQNIAL